MKSDSGLELVKEQACLMREDNHDKVYYIQIYRNIAIKHGIAYRVNFQYGRRNWGADLCEGTKTVGFVSLPEAEKIFNKMIKEKLRKGYLVFDSKDALNVWNMVAFEN